jgi:hypothetical protein
MPGKADKKKPLLGTWWRVPEEDSGGAAVYRKEGAPLPPARGRRGFTLHADGRATLHGAGPTDRRTTTDSHWQLDAEGRLHVDGVDDATAVIPEIAKDKLTLKR